MARVMKATKIIKGGKHVMFITGAGISVAANIPDFVSWSAGRANVSSSLLVYSLYHISQQFKNFIHRWLSIVAMVECAVHLTAALSPIRSGTRPFTSASSIAGLTAAISIAVLGVFSLPFVRRHAYELFLNTHIALTVIKIVAIFLHLAPFDFSQPSIILLIIAGSICTILIAARIGISLWNRAEVRIFEENGLLKADITLAKPRQVRAGFTRLFQAQPTSVRAFLEGPYGESPLAEDYGNVILFASGIGIAAHLGCIKQLLNARDQGPTRT
ncbi:uncharacterized protein PAC_15237 [Phialocephala subalpina]|uniref:Ferric oxidoreductase domain-containing protein n=1 Tax=Phialocephala subalpina TaxID=576137 RepID=A0A1L7XK63_9HELO|nr:uncharacterized protein PAC_15237 [Phialocephala subalpina]